MTSSDPKSSQPLAQLQLAPIRGWLLLVAAGMVFSPLVNLHHCNQILELLRTVDWDVVRQKGEMVVLAVRFEALMQVFMLISSIVLAFMFFMRKKIFPRPFIIYTSCLFGLGVIGAVISAFVPGVTQELLVQAIAFPVYVFVAGLIWCSYFLISKRVKVTFVVD